VHFTSIVFCPPAQCGGGGGHLLELVYSIGEGGGETTRSSCERGDANRGGVAQKEERGRQSIGVLFYIFVSYCLFFYLLRRSRLFLCARSSLVLFSPLSIFSSVIFISKVIKIVCVSLFVILLLRVIPTYDVFYLLTYPFFLPPLIFLLFLFLVE